MTDDSPAALASRIVAEVAKNPSDNTVALERYHLQNLHDAGAERAQALDVLARLFPDDLATQAHVAADLDSYGQWTGDEAEEFAEGLA